MSTALIETNALADMLGDPELRILDSSYFLPQQNRNAAAEFAERHIPGAAFFDIDEISDHSTDLPHMLPSEQSFGRAVGRLGIGTDTRIVIYDTNPMFGACRAWWMFRAFGHRSAQVLDGGLPKWIAEGRDIQSEVATYKAQAFNAKLQWQHVSHIDDVSKALKSGTTIVDVRPRPRFLGEAPEPRPNLRSGHMPGARNLPFADLIDPVSGCLLPAAKLQESFSAADVPLSGKIIVSCGSGVSACVAALALHEMGHRNVSVYDGSWAEWGSRSDTAVVTSP